MVEQPARFVVGELRGGARAHLLDKARDYSVVIRHGTRDTEIFRELFGAPRAYDPPPGAADALRALTDTGHLRVLDLGANIGLFAVDALARYPGATVTSYEPEPENFDVLARCANLNPAAEWEIVQACVLTNSDPVMITPGGFADSYVSDFGVEVPGVDVLPLLPNYDFVKMDIEGSEWPILRDERWPNAMRGVAAFVLEWHERECPTPDPRRTAIKAVEAAGFAYESTAPGDHGVVWAWRPH